MTTPQPPVVVTRGLTRRFGALTAVDALDLEVPAGSFYGFLGPNGAGKTTTIGMLTGLLAPSSGEAHVLGVDVVRDPIELRRRIGVVPDGLYLFERLHADEHLRFVGEAYGLDRATAARRAGELLEALGLAGDAGRAVSEFSHGMRKKLGLACALIHNPRLLVLDEPFEGIDAVASVGIRELLQRMVASGHTTVFLTSHVLEVIERLCTHAGIIHGGRLVAHGPLDDLRRGPDGAPRSLESLVLDLVGAPATRTALDWLGA
jgi:ABC-2 type transport system ATP-binding protein